MRTLKKLAFMGLTATGLLTGAISPQIAVAQAALASQPPAPVFDGAAKRQIITAAAKLLTDEYIFPDKGAQAAALLVQNLTAGKYDKAATPGDFAAALTADLQGLTDDRHLRVYDWSPPKDFVPSKDNAHAGPPPPPGKGGFVMVDRLKGNIGYIELDELMPKGGFKHGADSAMALVASTDALIIDLRNNHGGDVASVAYLDSFFFDGKTQVHVGDIVWRKAGTTDFDRQVFLTEPTPVSYSSKPVYLITSQDTFSGGEAFAYDMQVQKRATVVGEATGGGANPGGWNPVGQGLMMFVPNGRAENPVTHTNWEGKGVQPDVAVAAGKSFPTTYSAALQALGRPVPASADTLDAVIDARLQIAQRTARLPASEAALRRWEGGMADGHPPDEIFTEDGRNEAHKQVAFLQNDLGHRGALQSLVFAEVDPNGGDVYDATFADSTSIQFTIFLAPDGKIETVIGQPY
ncbi:MAG: S41 family peptidase [Asticcacaulis sp.]